MKILPFDAFEIRTTMSQEEAVRILDSQIDYVGANNFSGKILSNGFKISRMSGYMNSFQPVVLGQFREETGGVFVSIRMRMNLFVTGFMAVWFLMGIGMLITTVFVQTYTATDASPTVLIVGFIMLFIGWVLMSGCFWYEAKKAKTILLALFAGKEMERKEESKSKNKEQIAK